MDSCIFCKIAGHEIPGKIIYEDDLCCAFLDLSQAVYGHTLVVPKKHVTSVLECDEDLIKHCFAIAARLARKITTTLNAKGCNILSNANPAAGQSVMHFHIHILPRYDESDGFQMTFANHEGQYDLDELQAKLKAASV